MFECVCVCVCVHVIVCCVLAWLRVCVFVWVCVGCVWVWGWVGGGGGGWVGVWGVCGGVGVWRCGGVRVRVRVCGCLGVGVLASQKGRKNDDQLAAEMKRLGTECACHAMHVVAMTDF